MSSIASHVDGHILARQVRMERQNHKGSFLLLEGKTDKLRLRRFINEKDCSVVPCFGKKPLMEAIEILYEDGFAGALGLVDADFDRLLSKYQKHEGLIWSDTHDFDLDIARTSVLDRYLSEVADEEKISMLGGPQALFTKILELLRPLSAMRFANEKHSLGYNLQSLKIYTFFNGSVIDVAEMVQAVSQGRFSNAKDRENLTRMIERYRNTKFDLSQFTSGHDFCAALGIILREKIGSRHLMQSLRSEVEMHLRLTVDSDHLQETAVYGSITQWQQENVPYRVLKS
jgi:hypothetical protein